MASALTNVTYVGRPGCNTLRRNEVLTIKVINLENTSHNVTNIVNIGLLSVNDAPQIITEGGSDGSPRWSLSGKTKSRSKSKV